MALLVRYKFHLKINLPNENALNNYEYLFKTIYVNFPLKKYEL